LQSRSDLTTVAVGFSPRTKVYIQVRVAERRLNQADHIVQASLRDANFPPQPPWAEAHGYRHFLAPRGKLCPMVAIDWDPSLRESVNMAACAIHGHLLKNRLVRAASFKNLPVYLLNIGCRPQTTDY